jgi:hypothetical protein
LPAYYEGGNMMADPCDNSYIIIADQRETTMNKLRLTTLVVFAIVVFGASAPILTSGHTNDYSQKGRHADRVVSTKVIKGSVVRFDRGDYLWLVVKDSAGKEISFSPPDQQSMLYFLVEHKGKPLVITDQIVSRYIPENSGRMKIDTVKSVRYGQLTVADWWKQVKAKGTLAQLKEKYEKLMEEYTVTP